MTLSIFAQNELKTPNTLWFQTIERDPDFLSAYNYFVYKDKNDFTWISSIAGLNRYDGIRSKQYRSNPKDSTTLHDDNIQSTFFEDRQGNLWFTTAYSIQKYDRKSDAFETYFKTVGEEKKSPEDFNLFFLERDTFLWFKADSNIYRYNIFLPEEEVVLVGSCIALDLLVDTTAAGFVKYLYPFGSINNNKNEYLEIENGVLKRKHNWIDPVEAKDTPAEIFDLYSINSKEAWLGTDKGLALWNRKEKTYKYFDKSGMGSCSFVPYGKNYLLLWGSKRGFQFFDLKHLSFQPIEFRNTSNTLISPDDIYNIYIDDQSVIWVSFLSYGLIYSNPGKIKFDFTQIAPLEHQKTDYTYTCFFFDKNENLWYGTKTQGLFFQEKGSKESVQFNQIPNSGTVGYSKWITGIQEGENNSLWISTRNGILLFDKEKKYFKSISNPKKRVDIIDALKLKNGEILFTGSGATYNVTKEQGAFKLNKLLSGGAYMKSYEDHYNNIYISRSGTEIGVYKLEEDSLQLQKRIPLNKVVNGYHEDQNNKLWLSTYSGLVCMDIQTLSIDTIKSEADQVFNKSIHSILADEYQNIWLGTPKGLLLFRSDSLSLKSFSISDGTPSEKFHDGASIKQANGKLIFGGDKGLTIVDPRQISFSDHSIPIQITDIKINDETPKEISCDLSGTKNIPDIKRIKQEYYNNTLSFEFVGIDYSDPHAVQLQYKLEDEDGQWVKLKKGEPGFARYSNLKEGTYHLMIQSTNADGVWGPIENKLEIIILPPIQRTWWFMLLVTCSILALGYSVYRYRINQVREKASLQTRVAENKMIALRSQMNPHFIFNCLQTLNGLIARKEIKGAIEYVSEFASLMRMILENSRLSFIPLEQEIELLDSYLNVESQRFQTPFGFSFQVAEEVNSNEIQIPSMLLQPFVENSIKHGLFHKKEKGQIDILFNIEKGLLKCIIEDNGVGRKQSSVLNTQKGREHKSRGLEIIHERLDIINNSRPGEYKINIIDLFDRDKNPSGTRVEIYLPTNKKS